MKYLSKGISRLWKKDGVKFDRITYYPRQGEPKDPPIKPAKLFMVERVKCYMGQPYWNKELIDRLHLQPGTKHKIAIVKNTPEMCQTLMQIKHLVKITPIEMPEKLPEDLLTNKETYLHPNGKMMIFTKADEKRLEATQQFQRNVKRFDYMSMKKYLRLKWLNPIESNGSVHVKQ